MKKKLYTVVADGNTLNFHLPKCWQELSQKQLKSVLVFLSAYDSNTALVRIVLFFAKMKIARKHKNSTQCRVITNKGVMNVTLLPNDMLSLVESIQWILEPGNTPVLLEKRNGAESIDKMLHGVAFETYIMLDNLYQGYLMSRNDEAIVAMANIIYQDKNDITDLKPYEILGIVQWYTQVKTLFAKEFPSFLKRVDSGNTPSVREAMNAQIRALTGGDLTKEAQILAIDTWRALTELDAKAREAEDFKKTIKR